MVHHVPYIAFLTSNFNKVIPFFNSVPGGKFIKHLTETPKTAYRANERFQKESSY